MSRRINPVGNLFGGFVLILFVAVAMAWFSGSCFHFIWLPLLAYGVLNSCQRMSK